MAELIQTLLGLSRENQLRVIAILAEHLQSEETVTVPKWQIELAKDLEVELAQHRSQLLEEEAYWAEVYAHRQQHKDAS